MGTMGTATGGEDRGHAEDEETLVLVAARAYTRRGWRVVPVRPGEKGVAIVQWQRMRLDEDELPQWFGRMAGRTGNPSHNIGILTGEPSGGLVDVDCDAPEAGRRRRNCCRRRGWSPGGRATRPATTGIGLRGSRESFRRRRSLGMCWASGS